MDITLHIACKSDPLWGGIALLFYGICWLRHMVLIGLFLSSLTYALLLETPPGRALAQERTAETVILGTGLVVGWLRFLIPHRAWRQVVMAFAVAGSAMYARSLYNRVVRQAFDSE